MSWKKYGLKEFDGWLYGPTNEINPLHGTNIAYIFDDFETVIFGNFTNGILIEGRERRIKGYR